MIQKDRIYTLEITGMTHEGQGVGRIEGFTVFVDDVLAGETVEIKITTVKKSYAVGKPVKILKPSADRREPFCPAFSGCGGCSLQHLEYGAQLKFKTGLVKEALKRIGKLEEVTVHDTLGMEPPFHYRNKAQFPVGHVNGRCTAGFYAKRSHEIIESSVCGIQHGISDKVRETVMAFVKENKIKVYDETTGQGLVRHIMSRVAFQTGEVMAVMAINGRDIPNRQQLVDRLLKDIPQISSIVLNINTQNTNIILGSENKTIFGKDTVTDTIGEFRFEISPLSFFQVNPAQTEVLYGKALEYAGLTGQETVFDLYCGIGTISLFLSRKAKKVIGVEVVEEAVQDARRNAQINGVDNVEFFAGEAEKVIPQLYSEGIKADVVVVDPPRKGCDEVLLRTLVDMQPERIVYVSCNPSTLARDLKYLSENGFKAAEVQPVDMFPWTGHVETIVLIQRVYT